MGGNGAGGAVGDGLGTGAGAAEDVAGKAYDVLADSVAGIPRDVRFGTEGFKKTLKLRAELEGQWRGTPPLPEK